MWFEEGCHVAQMAIDTWRKALKAKILRLLGTQMTIFGCLSQSRKKYLKKQDPKKGPLECPKKNNQK